MSNEIDDKKSCENCKYYIPHYIKKATGFRKIYCGNCSNENFSYRNKRKLYPFDSGCDMWELKEEAPAKSEKIEKVLRDMAEQITRISEVLRHDSEK